MGTKSKCDRTVCIGGLDVGYTQVSIRSLKIGWRAYISLEYTLAVAGSANEVWEVSCKNVDKAYKFTIGIQRI